MDLTPDTLDAVRIRVPEHVVFRSFDAETILLNLTTGTYHGLNDTGGRMLEVLRDATSAGAAADAIAAEYEQPASLVRTDLAALCTDLRDRGLIEVDGVAD